MSFKEIRSYAKVNLALNITGKTSSLHKIESIIAFISLHDKILIRTIESNDHKILFVGKFSKNINKNNTVRKLIKILEKKKLLTNQKFEIRINKKIPQKSGLAGGSMNAASILNYFVKRNIIKINRKDLLKISKEVGSDVVLGLNPTNTILTSKNRLKKFKNCKKIYTFIVKPNFGCSTKDIYSKVRKFNKSKFNSPSKKMFNFAYLKKMNNSLEPIVLSKHPKLKLIKYFLENLSKPAFVRMTGSGSALVAYFKTKKKCSIAKRQFVKKYKNFWCIASKTI
jgi:4-diphosphocytidyl-2-C-methyl-D-erythritol kinase